MSGQRRWPSEDLCYAVVRMAALGWWPHTIEGCTGIPQPLVAEIVNRYYATGQVTPPVQNVPAGPGAPQGGYYMAAPVAEMPNVGVPTGYGQPQATRAASPAPLESSPEPEPEPAPQPEECSTELEDFHVEVCFMFKIWLSVV